MSHSIILPPSTPVVTPKAENKENKIAWLSRLKKYYQQLRGGIFSGAASAVGIYHATNEDSYRCFRNQGRLPQNNYYFFGVADGVGGGSHGDIASSTVLDFCAENPARSDKHLQKNWAERLNNTVQNRLRKYSDAPGASTLIGLWLSPPSLSAFSAPCAKITHVGDCRLYHFHPSPAPGGWAVECVTLDQTYSNLGLPIPARGSGDDPARMIGIGNSAIDIPPVQKIPLAEGEIFLLCSDGVHKFTSTKELLDILSAGLKTQQSLDEIAATLITTAKTNNSHDDVTALLIQNRPWLGIKTKTRILLELLVLLMLSVGYFLGQG